MAAPTYSGYQAIIAELAPGYDPRHIEACMRLQHGTLDHLTREDFAREAQIGVEFIRQAGRDEAEALAVSYGL